jgi:phosphate uptake regulator
MVKTKKDKKTKVKKISNVLQRVVVNVQSATRARSKNAKSYANNGFNQFQSQSRMMNELASMPNQIKQIVNLRRDDTNKEFEERFKQISIIHDIMNRQILSRVEKQSLDRYLSNIGGFIDKDIKEIKRGVLDIDTPTGKPIATPIP